MCVCVRYTMYPKLRRKLDMFQLCVPKEQWKSLINERNSLLIFYQKETVSSGIVDVKYLVNFFSKKIYSIFVKIYLKKINESVWAFINTWFLVNNYLD